MASYLERFIEFLHDTDPRTDDFLLTRSPYPVIAIIFGYLYFCLKCGPRFMERRPPYELKKTIFLHNLTQILLSSYISYHGTQIFLTFNFMCQPLDYSDNPTNNKLLFLCWLYMVAKFIELLDTVFFVLRKKFNQVTTLHVFHHTLMATVSWIGLKYVAGGHVCVFGLFNCYVHVVMYTYYLIANLGPEYKKYLWWKKYVTIIQLVQFAAIFIHNAIPLFTSCSFPKTINLLLMSMATLFIYMFGDFYINTYVKTPQKKEEKQSRLRSHAD